MNGSIHSELAKAIMSGRLEAAGRAAESARNSWPGNQTHPGPGTSRSQDASRGTPPQRQPLASGVSPWPPANHLTVAATVDTGDPGRGNRGGPHSGPAGDRLRVLRTRLAVGWRRPSRRPLAEAGGP